VTTPTVGRMLLRGASKRCPRCGHGGIFDSYFRLKERCPSCGLRFVREAGAFTGGLLMAWVFTLALMILPLLAYVFWRGISGRDDIAFLPFAIAAVAFAVVVPIVGYPFSNSTWAAIDLASNPMEADEIADAEAHVKG
jgi:ribosomal protein L37E